MAGYTVRNLKDVEDQAPKFGLSPNLEARFGREALESEQLGFSYQRLARGFRSPFGHRHVEQEEVYVLLGGSGRIKLDDDVLELRQWDVVRIAPETMRCLEAGPDGVELLAFSPRADGNDAQTTQGWWTD